MSDWVLWGISILTICGSILNIKKINLCFWIWSFCNVSWLLIDISNGTYSRAVLDTVNLATSIWGILAWHKNSSKKPNPGDLDKKNIESVEV